VVEVKKKKVESFESLLRRFHKKLQQSGLLIQSRKIRYHDKPKSRTQSKKEALRKIDLGNKREYLKKTGKLKEDPNRRSYLK